MIENVKFNFTVSLSADITNMAKITRNLVKSGTFLINYIAGHPVMVNRWVRLAPMNSKMAKIHIGLSASTSREINKPGDFVLVTWNETPTNEGRVVTVNGQQPVGDAEVRFTDLPDGSIPGYATYFWFVPERNVFAAIRFHHTLLVGKSNLERYLREYCAKFTSYVVVEENDDGAEIVGYSNNGDDIQHLRADFKSFLFKKPGQVEALRNTIESVTKVIRKNRLSPQVALHRNVWQRMLEGLRVSQEERDLTADVKIKYEIPFNPTPEQFDGMVQEWEENHESKWDDIGFKLSGDNEIRWLSHSVAKSEYELDVERDNDEIVDAQSLLDALNENRNVILGLVG